MPARYWMAGAGLGGGTLVLAASLAWLKFGEAIYVDRLIAGLAGCF
ncbi:hypothetical protein GWI72_11345 [Microvirga tunisiensis]|uniref:Uncharacterized protein n=2 Tax=Pannonibacter tanglangensis TaxID=2750084 RepID=A0ABW9ZHI6_9HYPH|nr:MULTISPECIES: hypothetical protein [unclassified Pannonibacter]NBN64330.1 hypothetical protein [Pannonibacter sp. XCT-34]NBN78863.1 hypothetical protein [Pannonibacter sp. XCT-53]